MCRGPEYTPSQRFVPGRISGVHAPEDKLLPAEEQPLPAAAKEDDDEDPEEDPADYPADGGDDGDDEDESSDDDEGKMMETESFETDESAATPPPHPAYHVTTRISIRDEPPTPFWSDTEVAILLAYNLLQPPLTTFLIVITIAQIPSPPLPLILSPLPVSSPLNGQTQGLLTTSKEVVFCFARPPGGFRADYGFVATMDREIMRDLERDVSYGITDTWDEMLVHMPGAPATDYTDLGRRMTEFATRVRQDIDEIYVRLDDEQTERQLMAGRLNMLYRDRCAHARTALLMEREARMSREAWGRSMDVSDLAYSEVMSLRTTVLGQQAVITELQAADRRRQAAITELLAADRRRQAAITELLAADRRRQTQFIEALKLLKGL
ncbi:hypothetical protein Tco_0975711 [Tanacetum coccineum]|uniref:Uncharacterized protein n=1 Tax=Tanacetum coccineum TaxID=301880 RepID=A0ABQ5EF49_9ASTR